MERQRLARRNLPKAIPAGISLYPEHYEMLKDLRLKRGQNGIKIPKLSAIVQEAIEELYQRELQRKVA